MLNIMVNGNPVTAKEGETILSAVKNSGIEIPTLCHMNGLVPTGACRICCVEVEGAKGLVPSCSYPVFEGMKIITNSPRIIRSRKTIIELLLANHPDDCLYCVRNGNCQLQELAMQYRIRERRFVGKNKTQANVDCTSPALVRDPSKCILCGKCVRVCEEVQKVSAIDFIGRGSNTVIAPAFKQSMNTSSCIYCGQCILVCPTGALRENSYTKEVMDALSNPDKTVIIQHAPAVSVTIAEEFGMKPGKDFNGIMVAALRKIGFDKVFDTSFSADLTIMEETAELFKRIENGGKLPMFTSCSPGWIKYIEQFYPELLTHVSTCKSPQQMLGAITKSYFAEKEGINPKDIFMVSIMPCTAKKFEASRPEMASSSELPDIDATLSTRELARVIKTFGIDFNKLDPEEADLPFGTRSSAGKMFAGSGGVMEAALRTAYFKLTGKELKNPVLNSVRGLDGVKQSEIEVEGLKVKFVVINGIGNAKEVLDKVKSGTSDLHFIEVMTCPGGCIAGGGQPLNTDTKKIKARLESLYTIDENSEIRASHKNNSVKELYKNYLGEPLGEKSHELLHTHYYKREVLS